MKVARPQKPARQVSQQVLPPSRRVGEVCHGTRPLPRTASHPTASVCRRVCASETTSHTLSFGSALVVFSLAGNVGPWTKPHLTRPSLRANVETMPAPAPRSLRTSVVGTGAGARTRSPSGADKIHPYIQASPAVRGRSRKPAILPGRWRIQWRQLRQVFR
ncbi:hypothetical protein F5X68DRAFT_45641 [Plectosphaerella plurivora]|uniref:Uncharacterized protein n=1 Tax=Plectosphaerella plurivora TaxID=936078 RepID=A0A9P8VKN2_9PEZI|nr:hypothetical protein F5X68DRAFT_45641 [Plectosphaerella plurivora]